MVLESEWYNGLHNCRKARGLSFDPWFRLNKNSLLILTAKPLSGIVCEAYFIIMVI
jgi:hypothetical protein